MTQPHRCADTTPMRWRVLVMLVASLLPVSVFWGHWQDGGLLVFPHFGEVFEPDQVAALRAIAPPTLSPYGYDGQFYAQIALHPALTAPDLVDALDNPGYRARRIGLPLLAAALGLGDPAWVLAAYSLLNIGFWGLLGWLLLAHCRDRSLRSLAVVLAVLWSSGVVVSMARALTDLPAATLGLLAVYLGARTYGAAALMSFSLLVKESSLVSLAAFWPHWQRANWPRRALLGLVLLLPVVAWSLLVHWRLPSGAAAGVGSFALPGLAWWDKLQGAFIALAVLDAPASLSQIAWLGVELAAPLCLAVQAGYLLLRWRPSEPIWGFGVGFAVLTTLIGPAVWEEFIAYTRVLLPLTIAFNLLLLRHRHGAGFWAWFVAGNCGLAVGTLLIVR
jgi:hypothetical protein